MKYQGMYDTEVILDDSHTLFYGIVIVRSVMYGKMEECQKSEFEFTFLTLFLFSYQI